MASNISRTACTFSSPWGRESRSQVAAGAGSRPVSSFTLRESAWLMGRVPDCGHDRLLVPARGGGDPPEGPPAHGRGRPPRVGVHRPARPRPGREVDPQASGRSPRRTGACGCPTCRRSGAAWAWGRRPWPRSRPRRPRSASGRSSSTPRRRTRATSTRWSTGARRSRRRRYLRPLCEGTIRSCFAMTEPEVAGSDPTLIKTFAYRDGDEWVINGHKWFISGARGREVRHPHRPHRGGPGDPPGRQHGLPRRPAQPGLGRRCATSRP